MRISDIPALLKGVFSEAGSKSAIPQTTPDPGRASYSLGFPPKTMTTLEDGGIPPDGRDMNGILFEVSQAALWQQVMGVLPFEAAFATAKGYPSGAMVQHGGHVWRSTIDDNNATPTAASAGWELMSISGGTSGQALVKVSGKSGDFVWKTIGISDVFNLQSSLNGMQSSLNGKLAMGNSLPLGDGAASAGSSTSGSRQDHRHPTDSSRAASDLSNVNASTGRSALGLGTSATLNVGVSASNVVQLDADAKLPSVDGSQLTNLPIVPSSYVGGRGQVFTESDAFTVPTGVTSVKARGCGGGGGASDNGGNGGTTSFGSYCSATGGRSSPNGGTGGVATGGDINIAGGVRTASGGGLCGGSGLFGGGSASTPATGYGNGGFYTGKHGGGGGYFERYITGLTPGDTIAVTIGAAGTAGALGGAVGTPGICIVEW